MKLAVSFVILLVSFSARGGVPGQSAVATLALGADRIGELKTAQGITTMIRFPDAVQEIICGDLYDAGTGKGNFVVQRSGTADHPGNEVFIKPVSSKGASNMFVKTDGKHTYSFDLTIVGAAQAHRMVNVTDPASSTNANPPTADSHGADPPADSGRLKNGAEEQARQRAAEIIRGAQQQADRKIAEADAKLAEAERVASQRADQEIERRFIQAMMLGMREVKVSNTRSVAKKVIITLDQRMVLIDDKAYLRYSIQNTGDKDFAFTVLSLETEGNEGKPLTAVINQSKPENSLAPGESLTGVIVFDSRQIGGKQRVALFLRGADSAELAHVTIQQ